MAVGVSKRKCLKVIIVIIVIQILIVLILLFQEHPEIDDDSQFVLRDVKLQQPSTKVQTKKKEAAGVFEVLPDPMHKEKLKLADVWSTNTTEHREANIEMSIEGLLDKMATVYHWKWMRVRIMDHWSDWMEAADRLIDSQGMKNRSQLEILVSPGLLTQTNFAQMDSIKQGGPLGELVQWADLIAALSILGHNVTLQHNIKVTAAMLSYLAGSKNVTSGCFAKGPDLIFTDYFGLYTLSERALNAFRHKLRVLDIYGTEAPFNNPTLAKQIGHDVDQAFDLHLQQYYTLYPGTPDNTFLGFTIRPTKPVTERKNVAVVYGKQPMHITHHSAMLRALSKAFELHATTTRAAQLPSCVINHGVLSPLSYHNVLQSAKVMIGVGHPVEGPGALEAISKGLIFLNPTIPPHQNPLKLKPTTRKLTSQVPYAEKYIGPPNVITLDANDLGTVIDAIPLLNKTVQPVLPYEFSIQGYLERLNYFLKYQDFCVPKEDAELQKSLILHKSKAGKDCIETCSDRGLVCDRTLFSSINTHQYYQRNFPACKVISIANDAIIYPSITNRTCFIQGNVKLLSCAGFENLHERFCPCRSYRRHQIALCTTCT